jgi:hypothetical protein
MKRGSLLVAVAALAGCASSGVIPVGNGTYMVTKKSAGGLFVSGSQVKADLYLEANDYCVRQGKVVDTVSASAQNAIPFARLPNAELQFRCVAQPSPEAPAASAP